MKSCTARLALNLGLLAVGLGLMSIGNQWLFFLGLPIMVFSGFFSLSARSRLEHTSTTPTQWLVNLLLVSIVSVGVLWLWSWGREGIDLGYACIFWFGIAFWQIRYWSAEIETEEARLAQKQKPVDDE